MTSKKKDAVPPATSANPDQKKSRHPELRLAVNRGWRLIPIRSGEKRPFLKGWPELATTDVNQIKSWLKQYPQCNWGVATGAASNLLVLDVDSDEALESAKQFGELPKTFTVKTANGYHFYFQFPTKASARNSASVIAEGLDVRGEGGQVVFPPSIHPTGAVYKILDDCDPAPPPAWLLKKLKEANAKTPIQQAKKGSETERTTIGKGKRNETLAKMAGAMHRQGMTPEAIEAGLLKSNELQFDPPVEPDEVKRVVKSITTRYEQAEGQENERCLLIVANRNADLVSNAERLLQGRSEERIFQTMVSRKLVRVIQYKYAMSPDETATRDPEASILTEITAPYLQLALGLTGKIYRPSKPVPLPADCPRQLAEMILSNVRTAPEKSTWSLLKKIAYTPVLLADGSLATEPGYHSGSKIWIDLRGKTFIDLGANKAKLSGAECAKLIAAHIHPFVSKYEFLREKSGQHWFETGAFAVVLSAMMSIDDRHNLPAVPMHCVSAPTQASGKTRLVQAICAAVTGTQPTIVTYDNAEEFAKHLPVLLAAADSAICVDNITMPVNNAKLAALLTQEYTFNSRPLGKSETQTLENVSVLFATGNNLQLSGDMPTRCLMVRIEPDVEHPEERWFDFDPVERALELFPYAVMAIKAVLRAHQLNGYPGVKLLKKASRFPVWDRRVRAAIAWAGYADPLATQEAIRMDDPLRWEHLRVLNILRGKFRDEPFLTRQLASRLSTDDLEDIKQITGHRDGEAPNERKIGKYLSHHLQGRWFEGIRLIKTGKIQGGKVEWRIEAKKGVEDFIVREGPL